ncbi:MAG TPA: isopentenyl phosphate kinase family protein [Thermoplasmata archaeon]|nr:isopentenyl phosphate kinase family protein [Thermoplasmata archaeon]
MILVKLGGSVLTDKNKPNVVRRRVLNRLVKEIKRTEEDVIVVHGVGSFGHVYAKQYKLNQGYVAPEQRNGFALTHKTVRLLNNIVLESLIDAGVPAVSLPPVSFMELNNGKKKYCNMSWFKKTLTAGLVPVTFGDVVFDAKLGFSICSGDLLMVVLAEEFTPKRAVFVIDEDGIYSANPKVEKTAKLLQKLSSEDLSKIMTKADAHADVTGGMKGKIESIREIADMGTEVWVVNGNKRERTYRALSGKKTVATIISGERV